MLGGFSQWAPAADGLAILCARTGTAPGVAAIGGELFVSDTLGAGHGSS